MSETKRYRTLREFYPVYLGEHSNRISRRLHFVGTSIGLVLFVSAVVTQMWWLIAVGFIQAYAFAWVGHFFFERNAPATFKHPLLSFRADFRMYRLMWLGKLDEEIRGRAAVLRAFREL